MMCGPGNADGDRRPSVPSRDPAYNGADENTENQFAPPSARPTDIAAVVSLEENADEFEISR